MSRAQGSENMDQLTIIWSRQEAMYVANLLENGELISCALIFRWFCICEDEKNIECWNVEMWWQENIWADTACSL